MHSTDPPSPTPASPTKSVAIFGAGIAGLTAAHELARLGHRVSIYETNPEPGGFFRSARLARDKGMPSEYSWHGMGPWYHNVFDLMRQIPFDERGSVFDIALSRPIDFGIFPNDTYARFFSGIHTIPAMFRLNTWQFIRGAWLMIKTWSANRRTFERYASMNAAEAWRLLLGPVGHRTWRASFGPWIGSDYTNVSLHTAGQFFLKQLITKPRHPHPADSDGPAWTHGAQDGWLLLRGPSSEFWFDKWIAYLESIGVQSHWNEELERFACDNRTITAAHLKSGAEISADLYIMATDPFSAAEIVAGSPGLENDPQLRLFKPLTQEGPHTQVSFRIAFAEPIQFPRERVAVVVANSEFNLTLFAQEQVWKPEVELGKKVESLWTGTSCVGTVPGRLYGIPVNNCTKEQFVEEVKAQILSCGALDALIREANAGRGINDFEVLRIEVWHEWTFSPGGITSPQPKWVNSTHTQQYHPSQTTSIQNLFIAGAHTQTEADVWSIEGPLKAAAAPPALDIVLIGAPVLLVALLVWFFFR